MFWNHQIIFNQIGNTKMKLGFYFVVTAALIAEANSSFTLSGEQQSDETSYECEPLASILRTLKSYWSRKNFKILPEFLYAWRDCSIQLQAESARGFSDHFIRPWWLSFQRQSARSKFSTIMGRSIHTSMCQRELEMACTFFNTNSRFVICSMWNALCVCHAQTQRDFLGVR